MSQKGYATNLASEFYVLSVLYRLGYDANLTLGNKKAIDIVVVLGDRRVLTLDVKAVSKRMDWLLGDRPPHQAPNHYVVLVGYGGTFSDVATLPRVWVFPSQELSRLTKLAANGKTRYISRKSVLEGAVEYEDAWRLLGRAETGP